METIGYIISGSLKGGFTARLTAPTSSVQEGCFVVVECGSMRYYGLVTDIRLGALDPRYSEIRTGLRLNPEIASHLFSKTLYTEIEIMPTLMQNVDENEEGPHNPLPVKMLPDHQSNTRIATAFDVAEIFGKPDDKLMFTVGNTREQGHPVVLNLGKLIERSSGIFGATGSGKSYLTRMILAGLIHSKQASVLVFDMHNEYAYATKSSDTGAGAAGLKDKLGSRVRVCALGNSTDIHGIQPDFDLVFDYSDITAEDILMLSRELNLRETTAATLSTLETEFHEKWLKEFMEMDDLDGWCDAHRVNAMAAEALRNKLNRVYTRKYVVEKAPKNAVDQIIDALENGLSVIMSFGKFDSDLDYLLTSNIITRKVCAEWEKKTNAHYNGGPKPTPLVIAVEEAHKLLNSEMAGQTAFSEIAREMRKYYVTLLVIDQRPSQIYDEVMSQLGTRISGWLGDEADIAAVLSGLSGKDSLRGMLSRLQPKQEVLMLGYGVPMPIPLASRRYDETFWQELLKNDFKLRADEEDDLFCNF